MPEEPDAAIATTPFVTSRRLSAEVDPRTGATAVPSPMRSAEAAVKAALLTASVPSATSIAPSKALSFVCCRQVPAPVLRRTPPSFGASVAVAAAPEPVPEAIVTVTASPSA